jgi:hypothetical protein
LRYLPGEVGLFKNLRNLSVDACGLKKLPQSIGQLERLEDLGASGPLKKLPQGITNCTKLRRLNLYGHQLPYNEIVHFATEFYLKGNLWMAVKLLSLAFSVAEKGHDYGSSFVLYHKEIIELAIQIINNILSHSEENEFEKLPDSLLAAMGEIRDDHSREETFRAVLEKIHVENVLDQEDCNAKKILNKFIDKCIKLAEALPLNLGKNNALINLFTLLFQKGCDDKGIEVVSLAIASTQSRPDKVQWWGNEYKLAELESISLRLGAMCDKLPKEGKVLLAVKLAEMIPWEDLRSHKLALITSQYTI